MAEAGEYQSIGNVFCAAGQGAGAGGFSLFISFSTCANSRSTASKTTSKCTATTCGGSSSNRDCASTLFGTDGSFNDAPAFYRLAAGYAHGHGVRQLIPWQIDEARPGKTVAVCGQMAANTWQRAFQTTVLVQSDSYLTLRLGPRR